MISATQRAHIGSIHPFPARMAPSIVWDSLPEEGKSLRVLDPMSGSGTTLVCAKAKGHHAIGYDTDPLAVLIARAWCANIDPDGLKFRGAMVLARAKALAERTQHDRAYPKHADDETRRFIDFWFDPENRRQLAALAVCISRVRCPNQRTLLWCAFSRLIITKKAGASLAMDVSHSRPHKVFETAIVRPFDYFMRSLAHVVRNCPFRFDSPNAPLAHIGYADARNLPAETQSVDMIITSPPYLNAIDYLRGHKLSLVWMGYTLSYLRQIRSENIGSEVTTHKIGCPPPIDALKAMGRIHRLDQRRIRMLQRYACDIDRVMVECVRVLRRGGQAIFVVGDSAICGVFVRNSAALSKIAQKHGLSLVSKTRRPIEEKRRYLPPPSICKSGKMLQSRMREEVILTFQRP